MEMELKRGEAGFSLIEAMIAVGILMFIAIGLMPLFYRALVNNALGNDYSQATTFAKSDLEENAKKPFENVDLTLTAGTSLQTVRYVQWVFRKTVPLTPVGDLNWTSTANTTGKTIWTRTSRVRQFPITAFDDGIVSDAEALPAGTASTFVQVKELTSFLDSGKQGGAGATASIGRTTLQVMKSF